jgi:hypothetical protein
VDAPEQHKSWTRFIGEFYMICMRYYFISFLKRSINVSILLQIRDARKRQAIVQFFFSTYDLGIERNTFFELAANLLES